MTGQGDDGVPGLAALLGTSAADLREAIGGPWNGGEVVVLLEDRLTTFTGLDNPRTPGRPLVAIRVEDADGVVDVGHAVGVPVPSGGTRWALAEPRTALTFDADEIAASEGLARELLDDLRDAVHRVVEAAVLRGTAW